MVCPNCKKENVNEYATVCAYCNQPLYRGENTADIEKELSAKQKADKKAAIVKAVLCVLLAIIIVIIAILIPKPEKDDNTDVNGTNVEASTNANVDNNNVPDNTLNNNGDGTGDENPSTETTTKKDDASKGLETTEEILTYFNKNANRVKTEATKVIKHYEDREVKEIVAPRALQSTAESMVTAFMKDDTEAVEYTTREEINENFQVPKQSYVSRLTLNDIKSASCVDKGDYYEITITVNPATNPTAGSGVGAAFDVIEAEEVEGKSDMVEDFSTQYTDCTVVAKFDKATNRMTHANYMIPTKLMLTVNFLGTHNASIDMSFEKDYSIYY